jgi:hypothetical protein
MATGPDRAPFPKVRGDLTSVLRSEEADAAIAGQSSYDQPVGKKMAVVVDKAFLNASEGDERPVELRIVWFVVFRCGEGRRFTCGEMSFTNDTEQRR